MKELEHARLTDREATDLAQRQRKQLKLIRKLLVEQRMKPEMIEAIDQAMFDNDQWG